MIIIDEFTGGMIEGRRYSDSLHQALESKEGVQVKMENQTLASITFQNFFRMYKKLSGMTGTSETEAQELKYAAIIKLIRECSAKRQPSLVGTINIEESGIFHLY